MRDSIWCSLYKYIKLQIFIWYQTCRLICENRIKWARELISCAQIPMDTTRSVHRRIRWRDTYTQNLHLYFKINTCSAVFIPWHIIICSDKNGVNVRIVGWVPGGWNQHECLTSRYMWIWVYVCNFIDISIQMCIYMYIYIYLNTNTRTYF